MKSKLMLIAIGGSLLLASPALRADDTATKPASAPHHERGGKGGPPDGLLPARLMEKLNLTDDQKTKIKAIDESFVKTRKEYMDAHKPEADAAKAAMKDARESKDEAKMKDAREKMHTLMEGLKPQRDAAMDQVKSLLTDEQKKTLEDAKKDFMEKRGAGKGNGAAPAAK